jgi:hypothetical protein
MDEDQQPCQMAWYLSRPSEQMHQHLEQLRLHALSASIRGINDGRMLLLDVVRPTHLAMDELVGIIALTMRDNFISASESNHPYQMSWDLPYPAHRIYAILYVVRNYGLEASIRMVNDGGTALLDVVRPKGGSMYDLARFINKTMRGNFISVSTESPAQRAAAEDAGFPMRGNSIYVPHPNSLRDPGKFCSVIFPNATDDDMYLEMKEELSNGEGNSWGIVASCLAHATHQEHGEGDWPINTCNYLDYPPSIKGDEPWLRNMHAGCARHPFTVKASSGVIDFAKTATNLQVNEHGIVFDPKEEYTDEECRVLAAGRSRFLTEHRNNWSYYFEKASDPTRPQCERLPLGYCAFNAARSTGADPCRVATALADQGLSDPLSVFKHCGRASLPPGNP